jgi:hypothetical protein
MHNLSCCRCKLYLRCFSNVSTTCSVAVNSHWTSLTASGHTSPNIRRFFNQFHVQMHEIIFMKLSSNIFPLIAVECPSNLLRLRNQRWEMHTRHLNLSIHTIINIMWTNNRRLEHIAILLRILLNHCIRMPIQRPIRATRNLRSNSCLNTVSHSTTPSISLPS